MLNGCEICGAEARFMVNDLREVEPIQGDDAGDTWARWEVATKHWFCEAHRRPSLHEMRPKFSIESQRANDAQELATRFTKVS